MVGIRHATSWLIWSVLMFALLWAFDETQRRRLAPGLSLLATPAAAQEFGLTGRWATQGFGSLVDLQPCDNNAAALCGRIRWLWEANDSNGRPRVDSRNPDRALRNRSLIGIEIISGFRESAPGVWTGGALYNPDDGRTYTGAMRLRGGVLLLQGCALNVFCQTQTWRRPQDILAAARGE